MRRAARVAAWLAAAWLAAAPAAAQHGMDSNVPDVPSGRARIVGEIVNPDAPERVGDVEVVLYALPAGGTPGMRRGVSDHTGRFVFEGISDDAQTAYLVGARYAGIPYPGQRIAFAPNETEKRVTVRVGDPTADASGVAVVESRMELLWVGGRLEVAELHRFENSGSRTVFVPSDRRAAATPLFEARLPEGAEAFQIPLGIQPEGLVRDGLELRFFGPLYPSAWPGPLAQDQGLAYQYALPAPTGRVEIQKRFPSGTRRLVILVPTAGPAVEVPGAREEPSGAQPAEAGAPRQLVVDGVPPGGAVTLRADVPEMRVDPDAVELLETRIFLELDDAALSVQEEHLITVAGETPVVAPEGGALLTLPVPPGAREVRFDREAFALGLAPDEGAGAVLAGPLPAGETRVQIGYQLPVGPDGGIEFEKRFGRRLPLLGIFVADTGLLARSERLHRRRPVRTSDRTYLALEAFEIAPSETVTLSLSPLAAPARLPRAALVALVAVAAGVVVSFVAAPLRGRPSPAGRAPAACEEEDLAAREREALYAALRDLDHDHETGKLSDEDYQSMRRALRARAAALLRAGPARAEAPAVASNSLLCPGCGADVRAADRFCAQCGARLVAAEARG